jgi:hypothetical protein
MTSRIEFQQRKIKTIKRSSYTLWDTGNQKSFREQQLRDITEEHYDSLGNLVLETNKTFENRLTDVLDYLYDFEYDSMGNLIAEHLENNFLPLHSKWVFTYDLAGNTSSRTTFDMHGNPHQIRYYFYDDYSVLVRDSLTQQGEPLFITDYEYRDGKIQEKTTVWAMPVKYQLSNKTTYSYSDIGLLEKEVTVYNQSTDLKIGGETTTLFFYNTDHKLIKTQEGSAVVEYFYDTEGNQIKRCDYKELPVKKYSFKIPACEEIEYDYY